jgi:hypothetical protein
VAPSQCQIKSEMSTSIPLPRISSNLLMILLP